MQSTSTHPSAPQAARPGCLLTVTLTRPGDIPELVHRAAAGDPESLQQAKAVAEVVRQVMQAPRRAPKLCACCPDPIDRHSPFAAVTVLPVGGDPTGIGFALCLRCAPDVDPAADLRKATEAVRRIVPGLRQVHVGNGGRA